MVFQSRKATVTVYASVLGPLLLTLLAVLLNEYTALSDDLITAILAVGGGLVSILAGTYNIGQGLADSADMKVVTALEHTHVEP
jgi:hypothetical protein